MKLSLTNINLPEAYRNVCSCCNLSSSQDDPFKIRILHKKCIHMQHTSYGGHMQHTSYGGYLCRRCDNFYIGYKTPSILIARGMWQGICFLCEKIRGDYCSVYLINAINYHAECFEKELDIELTLVDKSY